MDTAGKNAKAITEYTIHQLDKDRKQDQITMKEFVDPFRVAGSNVWLAGQPKAHLYAA